MHPAAVIPFLDPVSIIQAAGPWALLVVCLIIFAETALLIGFVLPGDTLLLITGVLVFTGTMTTEQAGILIPIWLVCLCISVAAFLGGEVGYWIGHKSGPRLFEQKESGLFSIENVRRTNAFFQRFGALAVVLARFVPVVRTVTPIMAGVGHMNYRKYSAYNAIGAIAWGTGITLLGFVLGYIPWLKDFVVEYIDLILIAVVVLTAGSIAVHYFVSRAKARRAGGHEATAEEVEALMVDLDDEPGKPWDAKPKD